jgi:predicted DNA-binding transcriptional regulator
LTLDFTLDKYRELCGVLLGYEVLTVVSYLSKFPSGGFVILRHDVDRMPGNALRMAELERELGITSTYYFRYTRGAFNRGIIKVISDMGHEVGYHYETLSKAKGDHVQAIRIFRCELDEFRKICEIKTVSMHGRPLSKHVNTDIWRNGSYREFDLLGDGSLSISGVPYFTDAGRSWDNRNNIRDYVNAADFLDNRIRVTDDLIRLLSSRSCPCLYLNIHPERWVRNLSEWGLSYLIDLSFNFGKRLINTIR